jgi:radical SAM superfamily enzyme YgiQ (UPF0313 family)
MAPSTTGGVVMDVLLAHAYRLADDPQERRIMRPYPPLGVLHLSSHLKRAGFAVGVFDGTFRTSDDFAALVRAERPRVVGVSINMMTKRHALRLLGTAKATDAWVVVGGPDPPASAAEYLAAGAHIVVIGEGERTLDELLPIIDEGPTAWARVNGLVFLDDEGALVRTPPRALIENLDAQPLPDREAIDITQYLRTWRAHHGYGALSLITARGCPFTCTWCSRSVYGATHRRRSPGHVADEVEHLLQRYRPDRLWYADDVFTIHRGWMLKYAAELAGRRIRVPYECISRAERIDDEVADALAETGCSRVWIGSESGSQRVLDAMRRRLTTDQVRETTRRLQRRGVEVGLFIMLGYEGEKLSDLEATVEHLKQTNADAFLTTLAYPIKGTQYYETVKDRVVTAGPWDERTDRDTFIIGRRSRRYYEFARRWMTSEVSRHQHWRDRRYVGAARAAASALAGRVGMALTTRQVDR